MADTSPWRLQCCQRMFNALADDRRATVVMTLVPFARKGSAGTALTITAHNGGEFLASCRHEITSHNEMDWIEQALRIFAVAAHT